MGLKDAAKKVGKAVGKVGDRLDVTCDKCGKMMKPGGAVKRTIGDKDHQFCCDGCANSFVPK